MRPLPLLTLLFTVGILRGPVEAGQTRNCDNGGVLGVDCDPCEPDSFLGPGGKCQRCSVCADRVVASPCTGANDTICGACATEYFESGKRCVKCSLEPQNPACKSEETTPPQPQAPTTRGPTESQRAAPTLSVVSDGPEMSVHVIYWVLGLGIVLVCSVLILCYIVFCGRMGNNGKRWETMKNGKRRRRVDKEVVNEVNNRVGEHDLEAIQMGELAVAGVQEEGDVKPPGSETPLLPTAAAPQNGHVINIGTVGTVYLNGTSAPDVQQQQYPAAAAPKLLQPQYPPAAAPKLLQPQYPPAAAPNLLQQQYPPTAAPNLLQQQYPPTAAPHDQQQPHPSDSQRDDGSGTWVNPNFWDITRGPAQPLQGDISREQQVNDHHPI